VEIARALAAKPRLLLLDDRRPDEPQESGVLTEFMRVMRMTEADHLLIEHDMKCDGRLRARHGARLRQEDREGAGRGPCGPAVIERILAAGMTHA